MRLRTPVLLTLVLLAFAAPAGAAVAPGRVTFPLDHGQVRNAVDAFGLSVGAALPTGGVALAGEDPGKGLVLAQLRGDGSLDPSFGQGGIAHVAVPFGSGYVGPDVFQLLRRPDGELFVVYNGGQGAMDIAAVTASGAADGSFGQNGIAATGVTASCGGCSPAAIGADGSFAVAGQTGASPSTTWAVARLTPTGAPDPSFGQNGIATLPGRYGYGIVLTSGRVATTGQDSSGALLARLLPNGKPDPTWNGGRTVAIPTSLHWPFGLLARADGSIDVLASDTVGAELRRYGPTGAAGLVVQLGGLPAPQDLLAAPDGGDLVTGPTTLNPQVTPPAMRVERVAADGTVTASANVRMPFGGGVATFFARLRAPLVGSLDQSGFHAGHAVLRPNGSLVVPGMVNVVQYTGEGVGFEVQQAAVAAITPSLSLDTSFGGAASAAKLVLSLPRQRASTTLGRNRLAVTVLARTNGPGLALITVKAGRRTIAKSIAPVLRGGAQRLHAFLTTAGRRYLRHRHDVRVNVSATYEDLVAQRATAAAHGILR